jgi:tetratricopeptide (TPR) repeat protein
MSSRGFRQFAIPVAVTVGAFLLLGTGLPWLKTLTPHAAIIRGGIVLLWCLLGAFLLAVPAAAIGTVWSWIALLRCRRRRDRAALVRSMKWVLLFSSCSVSLFVMEAVVYFLDHHSYRIPDPRPSRRKTVGDPAAQSHAARSDARERVGPEKRGSRAGSIAPVPVTKPQNGAALKILVIGESSAAGEPYDPWISVAQIVGWKLESVLPGRVVNVDVRARGGYCLEQALLPLDGLDFKPDAIVLFAGHNEFHARYGWDRSVAHYVEDGPESLLGLQELARSASATTHVIFKNLDRFYGEAPPPPHVSRELVDHPCCTPREYRFLLDEFQYRLDSLAEYCNRIGALAILIVPGSNDGAYEPSRSFLASNTSRPDRAEFATAFRDARSSEGSEPQKAIAAYRRLIAQHPEFAETHYRLGRLLAETGHWQEAGREFVLARDRDGLPVRCQSDFRAVFYSVARQYGSMLVDAPSILAKVSPHGVLDDYLYHDAHHMNLVGTIAVAGDILEQLRTNHAFGWPESTPVPRIEIEECARHFDLDRRKWAKVCERSSGFYSRQAFARYDPADRLLAQERYDRAAAAIAAGSHLDESAIPRSFTPLAGILEALPEKKEANPPP